MTPDDSPAIVAALAAVPGDALLRFLGKQRWFAAKGAAPASATVAGVVVMPWGGGEFAIARVVVNAADGEHEYQLPLAARPAAVTGVPATAIIETSRGNTALYDAVYDPEFRRGLANALTTGVSVVGTDEARWIAEPAGESHSGHADVESRVGTEEQSNTSIVFGEEAIFKLFRTLNVGIHPDVEVTRFLTVRAGFSNTPRLLASTRFEAGDLVTTSGMLQTFLPGSIDAWRFALECGRSYFAAPGNRDAPNAFVDHAKRLGVITRAMHDALSSDDDNPDFAPEPATPEDLDRWALQTKRSARDALALLDRQLASSAIPKQRAGEAQALVKRQDHFLVWIDEVDESLGEDLGMQIRIHGDFHLGQALWTRESDFAIIDFEGEPSRSLAERRAKTSALRDVAGILRSFAYAAATLATSVETTIDMPTRELRSARWERDVRTAYLAGYLGDAGDAAPDILPEENEHVHQLIALFEAEKAFYELAYELNNRPSWAWIPMRGISKLFTQRR